MKNKIPWVRKISNFLSLFRKSLSCQLIGYTGRLLNRTLGYHSLAHNSKNDFLCLLQLRKKLKKSIPRQGISQKLMISS